MSAYFESLNRRAGAPAAARVAERATRLAASARPAAALAPAPMPLPPAPGAAAAYAALRERLLATAAAAPARIVVFAGCDGSEGCTQVVREFAETLAAGGLRILLVDADMRTAGLTSSLAAGGGDLAELAGEARDPDERAWGAGVLTVVPSATSLADTESFLRSPTLAGWLRRQLDRYDYVLLDVPPLARVADALLVGPLCDGAVLVVRPGATLLASVLHARDALGRAGARVLGLVVNGEADPVPEVLRRLLPS